MLSRIFLLMTWQKLLDVTRYHASQVINEHFNMSFFELINSYRIKEAMSLMRPF